MAVILPAAAVITPVSPGENKKTTFITVASATAADTINLNMFGFTGNVDAVLFWDLAAAPAAAVAVTWVRATNVVTIPAGPLNSAISLLVVGDA